MLTGRPSKYNLEIAEKILAKVREGHYLHVAASAAGICRRTLNGWLIRGRHAGKSNEQFRDFLQRYMEAKALGRMALEACVLKCAKPDVEWNSSANMRAEMALKALERVYYEDWSAHRGEVRKLRAELAEIKAVITGNQTKGGSES